MIVAIYIIICELIVLLIVSIWKIISIIKELIEGGFFMGDHHKSNREVRKRKYTNQFAITEANKKRKAEKLMRKLEKRRKKKNG